MKIIYLFSSKLKSDELGIIKKIISQKEGMEHIGNSVHLYSFSLYDCINKYENITHITLDIKDKLNPVKNIYYYKKLIKKIIEVVQEERPDCIYLRDYGYKFDLHYKLSLIAPVFAEIQSNYLKEIKLVSKPRFLIETILKRNYLRNTKGLICITNEIYEIEKRNNSINGLILGNGIRNQEIQKIDKKIDNGFINLLFIGQGGNPWNGVERLIESFLNAPNRNKFMIHIVGYENSFNLHNNNIKFYGFVDDEKILNEMFSLADIGVGTLALYKKAISQAAPLKTRLYIAKGLPIIIGYDDIDLDSGLPFVLKIPNSGSVIDFAEVEKFYYETKYIRKSNIIIDYAIERLTWNAKMKNVCEFIRKAVEEKDFTL